MELGESHICIGKKRRIIPIVSDHSSGQTGGFSLSDQLEFPLRSPHLDMVGGFSSLWVEEQEYIAATPPMEPAKQHLYCSLQSREEPALLCFCLNVLSALKQTASALQ